MTFDLSQIDLKRLREDELALFDLLQKDAFVLHQGSSQVRRVDELLASIKARVAELDRFWEKEQTKADVEVLILDKIFTSLPTLPFTADEKKALADSVYAHVWQQTLSGEFARAA